MKRCSEIEYPGGVRCGGCGRPFEVGELMHPRRAGEINGAAAVVHDCNVCAGAGGEQLRFGA